MENFETYLHMLLYITFNLYCITFIACSKIVHFNCPYKACKMQNCNCYK